MMNKFCQIIFSKFFNILDFSPKSDLRAKNLGVEIYFGKAFNLLNNAYNKVRDNSE